MVLVMDTVVMVQDTVLDTDILEVTLDMDLVVMVLVMACMDRDMVLEWVAMAAVLAKVINLFYKR
jgi:hypothetical protein